MNWKDHPVYDSDTDFRFFWMMSKMQEIPEVGEVSKLNPYKFIPLQYHSCKKENLEELFKSTTTQFDGCLFYHKQAHYTFGASPLVVWLKPYMVGELLGIEIPDCMLQQKPANYSTYAAHMQQVKDRKEHFAKELEEKKAHRKQKRGQDRSKQFKMDVSRECDVSDTSISNEGNISKSSVNDSNVSEDMEHQVVANGNNVT
ncbi:snurportin-1-like [Ruditapes philippinarum]|uniref:snurportin-1-like n=1 Tax=Ruditapes philippinarum TaxID=129788 RepID=UPI00295A5C62|nr:snurportin-1-like [Ruditapes philippinarum]